MKYGIRDRGRSQQTRGICHTKDVLRFDVAGASHQGRTGYTAGNAEYWIHRGEKPQCLAAAAVALSGPPPLRLDAAAAARVSESGLRDMLLVWHAHERL